MKQLSFRQACLAHKNTIFQWLSEPHVQEFRGNTQEHRNDIINFLNGRKTPSPYAGGKFIYWIAQEVHEPFDSTLERNLYIPE